MAKRVAYLLVGLLLPGGASPVVGPAQLGSSLAAAQRADDLSLPNLKGIWEDQAAGVEVRILQSGREVTARYLEERFCEHRNGTGRSSRTDQDFRGQIQGNTITGVMTSCKYGSADAGYVWAPIELAIAADGRLLAGHWFNAVQNRNVFISFRKLDDEADAGCRDPLSRAVARENFWPFNRQTPSDIAPSCQGCSGGTWRFKSGTVDWKHDRASDRCIYEFEATWSCTTTGQERKTTKRKKTEGICGVPPRG